MRRVLEVRGGQRQRRAAPVRCRPETLHGKTPKHQVGVGDGGLGAAAAIAGRARQGAGAARPDLERAAGVDKGNAAAACAYRVDVDHRQAQRQVADHALGRWWGYDPGHRQTSVLVPPMSKVSNLGGPTPPSAAAPATANAPTTPPAGPLSTRRAAWDAACGSPMTPPLDCMMRSARTGAPSSACSKRPDSGRRAAARRR